MEAAAEVDAERGATATAFVEFFAEVEADDEAAAVLEGATAKPPPKPLPTPPPPLDTAPEHHLWTLPRGRGSVPGEAS